MAGLDAIQKRADEMPSSSGFDTYPTMALFDGDTAIVRFIGTGATGDPYTDSAYFHKEVRISKRTNKPYTHETVCLRSWDDKDSGVVTPCPNCGGENGVEAAKVSLKIGLWMWITGITRANQHKDATTNPSSAYPIAQLPNGQRVFWEAIDGPIVYKRGPGKDRSFLNELRLMRDIAGSLNALDYSIHRKGKGMDDTNYTHIPDPSTRDRQLTDIQKEVISQLPTIAELFSGKETWPRTMTQDEGGNEMIDPATLTTLAAVPVVTPALPVMPPPQEVNLGALPMEVDAGVDTPPVVPPQGPKGSVF